MRGGVSTFSIDVYVEEIEGVWYGVAIRQGEVYATTFSFEVEEAIQRIKRNLPKRLKPIVWRTTDLQAYIELFHALHRIFNGENPEFQFKLNMDQLTSYQKRVLLCLMEVPKGYVTTYGSLAKVAGGSARAVGNVMARNPFPLVVPCHRVVPHDLTVGNFGHGKEVKRELLAREDEGFTRPAYKEIEGRKLALFPVKFIKGIKQPH